MQALAVRNQTTTDLLINLFEGYGAVSNVEFRGWLTRKQELHKEGTEITPDELMLAAKNKYDTMVERGSWNAPTAEEKIVALEAKLDSTRKFRLKLEGSRETRSQMTKIQRRNDWRINTKIAKSYVAKIERQAAENDTLGDEKGSED